MADRGESFQLEGGVMELFGLLRRFKRNIEYLSKYVTHGDIRLHNVVHDGKSLHLIDFDEGVAPSEPLPKRNVDHSKIPWFQTMLYPNVLRNYGQLYTQVQVLAFLFLSQCTIFDAATLDHKIYIKMEQVGKLLAEYGGIEPDGWTNLIYLMMWNKFPPRLQNWLKNF